jgi:hypothetical protein
MTQMLTIFDRFADDLASFAEPRITIVLSRGLGMTYADFLLLKQSVADHQPSLTLTAIQLD